MLPHGERGCSGGRSRLDGAHRLLVESGGEEEFAVNIAVCL